MDNSETGSKGGYIKGTIDAVTGLVKALSVDDAITPAAKEIGKSLATVTQAINVALAPISALVWGYEQIKEFVLNRVTEKLKDIPQEKIITPDPAVVGPSLEALRFSGNDLNLRELYATLIATAMDSDKMIKAHPSFVEIIKNLTSDEALLMKFFQGNDKHPLFDIKVTVIKDRGELDWIRNITLIGEKASIKNLNHISNYIDNLCRLGLIEIPIGRHLMEEKLYLELQEIEVVKSLKKRVKEAGGEIILIRKHTAMTDFGKQFCFACIEPQYIRTKEFVKNDNIANNKTSLSI